jgi:hypothetical protein
MLNSIPNPKKELQVPFSNKEVQKALSKLPEFMKHQKFGSYQKESYDPTIGELVMIKSEFLSLGVKILISSHSIDSENSKISMEVQRQFGSFDKDYEVTNANDHLNKVTKAISRFLQNPEIDIESDNDEVSDNGEAANTFGAVVGGGLVMGLIVLAYLLL